MKQYWKIGMTALFAMAALSLATPARAADESKNKDKTPAAPAEVQKDVTVKGTVEVTKDDKGKVTGVELKGDDGTVYKVGPPSEATQLEKQAGKSVEVHGSVITHKDGSHHLTVKSIGAPAAKP